MFQLATVSRVINGSNVVKPATRERVLETIKRLDFKPNQIARGLATSKTTTIAVVFPQSLFGHVKDMIGGIGDTGRTLDFNIIMYTTDELGLGNPIEEVIEKMAELIWRATHCLTCTKELRSNRDSSL